MKSQEKALQRKRRAVRSAVRTTKSGRPRLLVYRSNRTVYAQLLEEKTGKVVASASGLTSKKTGIAAASEVGKAIADLAQKKKMKQVAFDRNGYKYHGQVKALAESARSAGLEF